MMYYLYAKFESKISKIINKNQKCETFYEIPKFRKRAKLISNYKK